jgi:hypothetical protein
MPSVKLLKDIPEQKMYGLHYYQEIQKPYGVLDDVIEWCKAEMKNNWEWQLLEVSGDHRPGTYRFFFEGDKDYCAFLLKWG